LADLQYVPAMTSLDLDGGLDLDPEERKGRGEHGLRLWKGKYRFRKDMLPRFVDEGFGKKVRILKRMQVLVTLILIILDFLNREELEFHSVQLP